MSRHTDTAQTSGIAQLLQIAQNHRTRFHDAYATMVNQLRAVSTLFGSAAGSELVRTAEALQEQHEEALYAYAGAFGERARENAAMIDELGDRIGELRRLRDEALRLLYRAADAEQQRYARNRSPHKQLPEWWKDANAAGYCQDPDEVPF